MATHEKKHLQAGVVSLQSAQRGAAAEPCQLATSHKAFHWYLRNDGAFQNKVAGHCMWRSGWGKWRLWLHDIPICFKTEMFSVLLNVLLKYGVTTHTHTHRAYCKMCILLLTLGRREKSRITVVTTCEQPQTNQWHAIIPVKVSMVVKVGGSLFFTPGIV